MFKTVRSICTKEFDPVKSKTWFEWNLDPPENMFSFAFRIYFASFLKILHQNLSNV